MWSVYKNYIEIINSLTALPVPGSMGIISAFKAPLLFETNLHILSK